MIIPYLFSHLFSQINTIMAAINRICIKIKAVTADSNIAEVRNNHNKNAYMCNFMHQAQDYIMYILYTSYASYIHTF